MGYRAVYEFIEDGKRIFAYSHWGGNIATGIWKYNLASEQFGREETSCATVAEFLMGMDYNSNVTPREDMYKYDINKIFNPISSTGYNYAVDDFYNGYDIEALVHINIDNNFYSYKNKDVYIELPLDVALEKARELEKEFDEVEEATKELVQEDPTFESGYNYWWNYDFKLEKILLDEYKKSRQMLCVVVEPGLPARKEYIDGSLLSMQKLVGGLIEPLYGYEKREDIILVGNEEARVMELAPNRWFEGFWPVCGTFIALGNGVEDFTSLTEEQADYCLEKYKTPHRFNEQEISQAHQREFAFWKSGFPDEKTDEQAMKMIFKDNRYYASSDDRLFYCVKSRTKADGSTSYLLKEIFPDETYNYLLANKAEVSKFSIGTIKFEVTRRFRTKELAIKEFEREQEPAVAKSVTRTAKRR